MLRRACIDTLLKNKEVAAKSTILQDFDVESGQYAVMTLHRPPNVDDQETLGRILGALEVIQSEIPVVLPIHLRIRKNIATMGFAQRMESAANLRLLGPIGYLGFLKLTSNAKLVLTDSGGI